MWLYTVENNDELEKIKKSWLNQFPQVMVLEPNPTGKFPAQFGTRYDRKSHSVELLRVTNTWSSKNGMAAA